MEIEKVFGHLFMTIVGLLTSISSKIIYSMNVSNIHELPLYFRKPFFLAFTSFASFFLFSIIPVLYRLKTKVYRVNSFSSEYDKELRPLLDVESGHFNQNREKDGVSMEIIFKYALLSFLDIIVILFHMISLLLLPISTILMFQTTMLIWEVIYSGIVRKKLPFKNEVYGVVLTIVSIIIIAYSTIYSTGDVFEYRKSIIGIICVTLRVLFAFISSISKRNMLRDNELSHVQMTWNGFCGVLHFFLWIFPVIFLLPGFDGGRIENTIDSLHMIAHSWKLAIMLIVFILATSFDSIWTGNERENLTFLEDLGVESIQVMTFWIFEIVFQAISSKETFSIKTLAFHLFRLVGYGILVLGGYFYQLDQGSREYSKEYSDESYGSEDGIPPQPYNRKLRINEEGYIYMSDCESEFYQSELEEMAKLTGDEIHYPVPDDSY